MNALLAAHYGVPVTLATGDEAFAKELGELLPDTEFVSVKRAIRRTTAELLHPEVTAGLIREAAARALESIPEPLPAPGPPVAIEIRVHPPRPGGNRFPAAADRPHRSGHGALRSRGHGGGLRHHPCPLPQSVRVRRRSSNVPNEPMYPAC